MLKSALMVSIASQEQEGEHEVLSDTPDKKLGQNVPDLHPDTMRLEGQDAGDHDDRGAVIGEPSPVAPESTSDDDQLGERAQRYVQSRMSGGECQLPDDIPPIDPRRLQRDPEENRCTRLAPFTLVPQWSSQTGSVLSRLHCEPFSPYMLIERFNYNHCS